MKKVYIYLANGFEEVEAITPIDFLRRAGADVTTVAVGKKLTVTGSHGIDVLADKMIEDIDVNDADMIVLPGGFPGYQNLAVNNTLTTHIDAMIKSGRLVGAICGAPAAILGNRGYLEGKKATCYPGMEDMLTGAVVCTDSVCVDGNVITSRSAGTATDFAMALVKVLLGEGEYTKLKKAVVLDVK